MLNLEFALRTLFKTPFVAIVAIVSLALGIGANAASTIGESHVVVLSYAYWQSRLGVDPGVLNQPIIVNGQTMTIVGVTEQGFDGTTLGVKPRLFAPIRTRNTVTSRRRFRRSSSAPPVRTRAPGSSRSTRGRPAIPISSSPTSPGSSHRSTRTFPSKI